MEVQYKTIDKKMQAENMGLKKRVWYTGHIDGIEGGYMFYNAKNSVLKIEDTDMHYISFGNGPQNLIMIPGLGDGLKTVKGMAVPFSVMYKDFAKNYKVYVFSRRNKLPDGFTTRDMAHDIHYAMEQLGIEDAYVMGVSQGGMIAQYLAIDFPETIKKLVLLVTLSKQNYVVKKVISTWIKMAKKDQYAEIMIDTAEKSYTEKYLEKMRPMYKYMGHIGKPKSFDRFLVMADACLSHDAYEELDQIQCPTLVIGGTKDHIVTGEASKEIAEKLADCELYMYEGYGHGVYEEEKDCFLRVLLFLQQNR